MVELTAGYVAGIIAFGIVVAQLWCPNAITFFLAGQLQDRETAATWTVAGRFLHSSLWPTLLQSDSSKNHGVRKSVILTTLSVPLIGFLVSIAGVVTPLGLYEVDEPDGKFTSTSFQYVPDASAFRSGTSPRDDRPFTRTCPYSASCYMPCPYTSDVFIISADNEGHTCDMPYGTNASVSNILHDIYGSGTKNRKTTISNFFDIEWRQLTTQYNRLLNNGTPVAVGTFRLLESLALGGEMRAVEGLVVDGKNGSIGFRNHTLPTGYSRGVTWSEDLLFMEPEVECVNTNLTIDFEISTSTGDLKGSAAVAHMFLTDRGGFVNLNTTYAGDLSQNTTTNTPDLKTRAYQAAWFTNGLTMMFMDITDPSDKAKNVTAFDRIDSELNQEWEIPVTEIDVADYQSLSIVSKFSEHLGLTATSTDGEEIYKNPYNVTASEFDYPREICQGTLPNTRVMLNSTFVTCSFVRGVPKRTNNGPDTIFEDGSKWSAPTYSCASTIKATIKTVTFFHNGTDTNLDNLVIQSIKDKEYKDESDMPMWGVEDTAFKFSQFEPIWGIVDPAYEGFQNVSTMRAPSFYMLGSSQSEWTSHYLTPNSPSMNLPGYIAPISALQSVATANDFASPDFDFSAKNSMSLWMKWKELSTSEDSMSTVIKLLWSDLAASAMVGSKGVLGARNAEADAAARISVLPTVHRVKYHWAFGIPAFIVIVVMGIIFLAVFISAVTGQSSLDTLGHRIKQVSVGRVLTTIFHPDASSFIMSTADWSRANAEKPMNMAGGRPTPSREGGPPLQFVNNGPQPFNSAPPAQAAYQNPAAYFPPDQQEFYNPAGGEMGHEMKPYFPEPKN
ncbi:hypothetical protein G7Z17_g7418 [Cylindrodendrum hubeiense]|uniref:Uncharacterized protein n=1 Tax=Cylindrodendrum hubeiense TaxID=595255 RepID=A0A9P5H5J9_9HYPO|nr:hypothetical protein G7Z17_g7418 [Cylindrodendrum hubeiense]